LRGEVGAKRRVRGYRTLKDHRCQRIEEPLTPTLSPQERGEGAERAPSAKLGDDLDLAHDGFIEGGHFFRRNPVLQMRRTAEPPALWTL